MPQRPEPAWRRGLRWAALAAAGAIVGWQVLAPPIIGLADQGDFARIIGHFGYAPEDKSPVLKFMYIVRKYVPGRSFRYPDWEQFTSEYLFCGAAVALNRVFSRDGKLDITVVGAVHALAFLAAFARLLWVTRRLRVAPVVWLAALLVLTDVAYTAYWNSFYSEPASFIFFVLLAAESIAIGESAEPTSLQLASWTVWAALFVLAKPQNAPIGLLLAAFCLRLGWWSGKRRVHRMAAAGSASLLAICCFSVATVPQPIRWETGYDMIFRSIVPESHHPQADLASFGLDPNLAKYGGTWAEGHPFYELVTGGAFRTRITPFTIARFYLLRPTRFWKHIKVMLGSAFLLRDFYGNFEKSTGYPAATRSTSFSLWSGWHQKLLEPAARWIFFLLLASVPAALYGWRRVRTPAARRGGELAGMLLLCCLAAFFTVVLGDCWDNIKHFYLFNLLFDACVIAGLGLAAEACLAAVSATGSRG